MAFPTGWNLLATYTIDHTKCGTEDITNYELLMVDGNFPDNVFANCDDGGGDLRFSSDEAGTTQLSCHVRSFNTSTNAAQVVVSVPTVSYTVDTVIYIWGDNTGQTQPGVAESYGQYAAYNDDFAYDGGTGLTDFAQGIAVTNTNTTDAAGKIDRCRSLSGTGQDLTCDGTNLDLGTGNFTIRMWIYPDNVTGDKNILGRKNAAAPSIRRSGATLQTYTNADAWNNGPSLTNTAWNFIVFGFDGTQAKMKVNNSAWTNVNDGAQSSSTATWCFGSYRNASNTIESPFPGDIDEIRIDKSALKSDSWLTAEYNNLNSPSTFGTGEEYIGSTVVTPEVLTAEFSIQAPTLVIPLTVAVEVLTLALTLQSPQITIPTTIIPNVVTLTLNVIQPTILAGLPLYNENTSLSIDIGGGISLPLDALKLAMWNTLGRPTEASGLIGYNVDTDKIELFDGTNWQTFSKD